MLAHNCVQALKQSVSARAEERRSMEFGDWEVDDAIWDSITEEGEVQEFLPKRRAREAREVALANIPAREALGLVRTSTSGDGLEETRQDVLLLVDAENGFNNLIEI